ncbi:MAG: aldo/keto reductase [Chloroflexi bacterium]|nr:aldo/keto reductase [Chloroflexota bacterium]
MRYRHLGNSGLEVSEIGLGTNNFGGRMDAAQAAAVIDRAIELGINMIDTANIYSKGLSEQYIGRAIKGKREKVLLATKFGMKWADGPHGMGGSRQHIADQVHGSLQRLGTDYIDVYQFHQPDPNTPLEETLRALDDLVRAGKVRYIGCSNFPGWQIADAAWTSDRNGLVKFVSAQPEYSMLERSIEKEVLPACRHFGLGILPYYPLAHGFLTGKYRRGMPPPQGTRLAVLESARQRRLTDQNFDVLERLEGWLKPRGHSMVDLAFAWLLAHPEVSSVIAGASTPNQVEQNAAACNWKLSNEELAEVNKALIPEG